MAGNLPEEVAPFVGRRSELAEIRALLTKTRVLTLTGTGGVGKTRLALATARSRRRNYRDGVWYVALDGIEDEQLLLAHVSNVLGHRSKTQEDITFTRLAASLQDKELLLILDNCEQVVTGAARLADAIARGCPRVHILATSRITLRAAGDVTYQVPPLSMPRPGPSVTEREIDDSDAVQFFLDRARIVLPGFAVTADNRAAVHDLVRRLDRLPLAVELAAVRLRSLTVHQIVERMAHHQQPLLTWGSRAAPTRQQTMRASLQWSADLCTSAERRLWARLSVFRGTFDIDAVEAVCQDPQSPEDVVEMLQSLVESSILLREDSSQVVRYSILEVIRQFGQALLSELHEDETALRQRHTAWYLALVGRANAEWNTARQEFWLQTFPLEHKNIVAALSHASQQPDTVGAAAEAVCGLRRYYWWARGWLNEGMYWVRRCEPTLTDPVLRARMLLLGSQLAETAGNVSSAASWLREGERAATESGDQLALALVEHVRGASAIYAREPAAAVDHLRRALALHDAEPTGHRVDTLLALTLACAAMGDVEGAAASHQATLASLTPAERFQRSYSLLYVGEAFCRHGELDKAATAVGEALRLKAELDDPFGLAWALEVTSEIAFKNRSYERAALLLGASARVWDSMAIGVRTLERLQIREGFRDRLRAAIGSAALTEICQRGQQLTPSAALSLALQTRPVKVGQKASLLELTARESEIAELVAQGLTNKQIGFRLAIAPRTVDAHVQNMLTKLGSHSRTQIATWITERSRQDA